MNIKWAYYLIAAIYVVLIVLRIINHSYQKQYEKENKEILKAFIVKKDFFTTVSVICVVVTLAINISSIIGGIYINTDSIIITCLVLGFTSINSLGYARFSKDKNNLYLFGYTLSEGDVKEIVTKQKAKKNILNITFNRDIESYNFAKLVVYGKNKDIVSQILENIKQDNDEK